MRYIALFILGSVLGRYASGWLRAWRKDRAWSSFQRQHQGAMQRASLRAKTVVLVLEDRAEAGR